MNGVHLRTLRAKFTEFYSSSSCNRRENAFSWQNGLGSRLTASNSCVFILVKVFWRDYKEVENVVHVCLGTFTTFHLCERKINAYPPKLLPGIQTENARCLCVEFYFYLREWMWCREVTLRAPTTVQKNEFNQAVLVPWKKRLFDYSFKWSGEFWGFYAKSTASFFVSGRKYSTNLYYLNFYCM